MTSTTDAERLERAIAAIDAANADDPFTLTVDGEALPKELTHAEMMTRWVLELEPGGVGGAAVGGSGAPYSTMDDPSIHVSGWAHGVSALAAGASLRSR